MIKSLSIKNYALIQSLEMSPSPHLNIITGETGAGKSIMLGAVGLLLGNRADTKALFSEEEKCMVEGIFDIKSYCLQPLFDAAELEYEDECIIRREISPGGKSRAFVNDTPVTLDILKELGEKLMDIHSQHENLQLGNNLYQLEILDLFAGNHDLLATYQRVYKLYRNAKKEYDELTAFARDSAKETDYQQFLFNELAEARLDGEEQEALEKELELLENAGEIKLNLVQLNQLLDESEFSLLNQLKLGLPLLSGIKSFSPKLEELYERIYSMSVEAQDITNELTKEQDAIEYDPERTQIVKDRLDLLFRLQQKHQVNSVAQLIEIRDNLSAQLESVLNLDEKLAEAKRNFESAEQQMLEAGRKLSESRKKAAPVLSKDIGSIIQQLGISNGIVELRVGTADPSINGTDLVEMLFSANKGVQPRDIKHVASGGEFSRLIFAIKYLIADKTALPTIIFDEIDTGVSGEVAIRMVSMMKQMARNHQVIAISHLPQFAAGGDAHYFVYKDHSAEKSESKVKKLEQSERILEIAKMIGGVNPSKNAIQSARDLLN